MKKRKTEKISKAKQSKENKRKARKRKRKEKQGKEKREKKRKIEKKKFTLFEFLSSVQLTWSLTYFQSLCHGKPLRSFYSFFLSLQNSPKKTGKKEVPCFPRAQRARCLLPSAFCPLASILTIPRMILFFLVIEAQVNYPDA